MSSDYATEGALPIITLTRTECRSDCTVGEMVLPDGKVLHTLERPDKDNQRMVSCIPAGSYDCQYMEQSSSGKFKPCWWLQDVKDRSEILIHSANYWWQLHGCIGVGLAKGEIVDVERTRGEKTACVWSSRKAIRWLQDVVGGDFILDIQQ